MKVQFLVMLRVFSAFDSSSRNVEVSISEARLLLKNQQIADLQPWTQLRAGGTLILPHILQAIEQADLVLADISTLNSNVLFELGYAIARKKNIVLSVDKSEIRSEIDVKEMDLLAQVNRVDSQNPDQLIEEISRFSTELNVRRPLTLFEQLIASRDYVKSEERILYLKPKSRRNSINKVTRHLLEIHPAPIVDDANEETQILSWYVRELFSAAAVICHFLPSTVIGCRVSNARYGLIAGIAHGLGRRLLMIAEKGFEVPFDYKDLLVLYEDANRAVEIVKAWESPITKELIGAVEEMRSNERSYLQVNELKKLSLGDSVAEREVEGLIAEEGYFIQTSIFRAALEGKSNIFIGRRGTGKSATFYRLQSEIEKDPKAFVCFVKPEEYELSGLLRISTESGGFDRAHYALQSLWKYLLLTEIATQLADQVQKKPTYSWSTSESSLVNWVLNHPRLTQGDFATRLEDAVRDIESTRGEDQDQFDWRTGLSNALHSGAIRELNDVLRGALSERSRVSVLIDNLDKAWNSQTDVEQWSEFIRALLVVASDTAKLFDRKVLSNTGTQFSVSLFLRSDIYHKVRRAGWEYDKTPYTKVDWTDRELLKRVIEERYEVQTGRKVSGSRFWSEFFEEGEQSRELILDYILQRPRDLVQCVSQCLSLAIDRGMPKVRLKDVQDGLVSYSKRAVENVLEETAITNLDMNRVIYEFVGCNPYLTDRQVKDSLMRAGVEDSEYLKVRKELCLSGFLGIRVGREQIAYAEDITHFDKILKQGQEWGVRHMNRQLFFSIQKAFWPELQIGMWAPKE